jgi:MFS family permease
MKDFPSLIIPNLQQFIILNEATARIIINLMNQSDTASDTNDLNNTKGYWPALKNPAFFRLWLGQVFSQVADKFVFILLVTVVSSLSDSSRLMSITLALHTAPNVLLGAAAGVLVDRLDKKNVLLVSNIIRALLLIVLGVWGINNIWVCILCGTLISCAAQPFIPAESALIPQLVEKTSLTAANSLFATTMIGSIIVAFITGEPLVQQLGSANSSYSIALLFVISVGLIALVPRPESYDKMSDNSFLKTLMTGWSYIVSHKPLRQTLWQQIFLFGMFASQSVLAILFAKTALKTNFSWFLATAGVGLGLGSWLVTHVGHNTKRHQVIGCGFLTIGLGLLGLAFLPPVPLYAFICAGVIGLSSSFVAVPLQTQLQHLIPEERRGQIFGAQNTLLNIATTLPLAGCGFLVELFTIQWVFAGIAIGMLLVSLYSFNSKVELN